MIKDLNIRPETIKLLEGNIGKTFSDINHSRILYDPPPRVMEIKAKQMGPNWTLLHNAGNYKQGEKTAFRMGENNSKWSNWQRINIKNIQAVHAAQFQKNKWPDQQMGQRT